MGQCGSRSKQQHLGDRPSVGVTICPYSAFSKQYQNTVIYCDARSVCDIRQPGIYIVLSRKRERGPNADVTYEVRADVPIRAIRIFPKRSTQIIFKHSSAEYFLRSVDDKREFAHPHNYCDILISSDDDAVRLIPIGSTVDMRDHIEQQKKKQS
jgi:hypothetical protein